MRVGAPQKRKSSDGVMSACKRHTRAVAAAEDADYADDDVVDPYLHVSSESEQEDLIDNVHHHVDESSPIIPASTTTNSSSDKNSSNSASSQSSLGAFRPSALSSRLGFNMNLLNRYPSYSTYHPAQPNPSAMPSRPAVAPIEQGSSSQLSTYGDIESTSSDLYAIGPSFSDKDYDMMIPSQDGGYNVKSFNVDEMLEFLDTL